MHEMKSDSFHKASWDFTHASCTGPTGEDPLCDGEVSGQDSANRKPQTEIWTHISFWKQSFLGIHVCSFIYMLSLGAFKGQQQSWGVPTVPSWPEKMTMFMNWPFTERDCWLLIVETLPDTHGLCFSLPSSLFLSTHLPYWSLRFPAYGVLPGYTRRLWMTAPVPLEKNLRLREARVDSQTVSQISFQ